MSKRVRKLEELEWLGGHPALDFVNTVNSWMGGKPGAEYLHGYAELLRWQQMADLIGPLGARALSGGSARARAAAHRRALELRGALQRIFRAIARQESLPQEALDALNRVLRDTVRWRRLTAQDGAVGCLWDFHGAAPEAVLGPVAWQAAELLEHGPLERVKQCPDAEGCGWLFFDTSKNRSRTWCSMRNCGNAAKVKRFRARRG